MSAFRYLSVCSGIEAATVAWHPLGWRPAAFSEVDKFPRAVLAHHYPDVPLHGDFTTIDGDDYGPIDLLVGGTPCQDFSIAGLRRGLAGDRGNLTLEFLRLAARTNPRWILWENVPGLMSMSDGATLQQVLDGFTQIGYACDIDICDAQYFGLPQRRERVFIVCVRLNDLLPTKTPISARIAGELLLQPLLETWAAILQAWCPGRQRLGSMYPTAPSANSARRKIELLEKALDGSAFTKLRDALGESQALVTDAPKQSASISAQRDASQTHESKTDIDGFPSPPKGGAFGGKNTASSWSKILDALSRRESASTTSTLIAPETSAAICIFASQSLSIAQSIIDSKIFSQQQRWSSDYWHLASLLLTMMEAITHYAEQATNDLFVIASERDHWRDCLDDARCIAVLTQQRFGNWFGARALFSLPESLQGNSAPRREAREGVAPTLSARTKGGGGLGTDFDCDGGLIAFGGNNTSGPIDVATALQAHGGPHGRQDFGSETFIAHAFDARQSDVIQYGDKTGPLDTDGHNIAIAFSVKDHGADAGPISPTLRAGGFDKSHANGGVMPAVAFDLRGREGGAQFEGPHDTANIRAASGGSSRSYIATTAVRRLTPRECCRLQGFPDDYLDITYRGRPAADGPKYKALGNSMAVPVMAWIGKRIAMVEAA